ncbi:Achaete-scute 2 [Paragonimus heterotremus]|uniref:Achaete-scute 2 n=1 Tax=Paragonimus heterotremus TaxID=100268 RepID=A0A8J4TJZ6_9TREM|nr:Achaete-scute 2 [Paragonimus heterotremus]
MFVPTTCISVSERSIISGLPEKGECKENIRSESIKRNLDMRVTLAELDRNVVQLHSSSDNPAKRQLNQVITKCESRKQTKPRPASSLGFTPVSRRNERERNRVKLLNLGFERLRSVVPSHTGEQLSKISTLKKAIWYIEHLDRVLHGQETISKEKPASDETLPRTPTIPSSQSSEVNVLSGRRDRADRTDRALETASWPSSENTPGVLCTNLGGRPAERKPPSPIFPPKWGYHGLNDTIISISSTPKVPNQPINNSYAQLSDSDSLRLKESGYWSIEENSVPSLPIQSYRQTSGTSLPQPLMNSLGNFSALFPYYCQDVKHQPLVTQPSYRPASHKKT